jgi:hypothetical protein
MEAGLALDDSPACVRAKGSKLPKVAGAVFEQSGIMQDFPRFLSPSHHRRPRRVERWVTT